MKKLLQGPRPSPLKIYRDSHKIRKASPAVAAIPSMPIFNRSQPVIVYMESPKIIHAEEKDFMSLVQRLTGRSSSPDTFSDSIESDNLTAHHSKVHQASADATTSYQPAGYVENMGMSRDFVNPNSRYWTAMIDRNQEIGRRVSGPEANEHGQCAVTSASIVATTPMLSPLSPNFLFPSPRLNFSTSIFRDLPRMTPCSDHFFYSPDPEGIL